MTSNTGAFHINDAYSNSENIDQNKITSLVINELKATFRPEFLNRIDETIVFNPLTKQVIAQIVKIQVQELNKMLVDKEIKLDISEYAIEYLSKKGYEPQYGARPIKRLVQKEILNGLSKELLEGKVKKGDNILIDSFNDNIVFRKNESKKENKDSVKKQNMEA